ncbi:MAG: hypothetical protein OEY28_04445 [Nitrospira sp.]|nr:hypothetical protein [Nitrospira sp.]
MAVVAVKSTLITNADATPVVLNSPRVDGAFEHVKVATAAITSGDDIASTYRMFRVPSNAVMTDLRIYSPDIGTTTIADIGLYAADGGAVADADFFASALSLKDGSLNGVDVLHEAAVFTIANSGKELWDALGLTSDPSVFYDVAFTLTAAADATATVKLIGRYTA